MISRVQKIITEMSSCLKHELGPELCGKMAALYNYVYRKLVEANIEHKIDSLDEALNILRYQRETWAMLLEQLGKTKAAAAATTSRHARPRRADGSQHPDQRVRGGCPWRLPCLGSGLPAQCGGMSFRSGWPDSGDAGVVAALCGVAGGAAGGRDGGRSDAVGVR